MNLMRKLAWAAVVATAGAPPVAVEAPASTPTSTPSPAAPTAAVPQPRSRWFAGDDEDLGDDDFEGEGWTFWGL